MKSLASFALAFALGAPATAVTLLDQDRGVFTRSSAIETGAFDAELSADEASGLADFAAIGLSRAVATDATGDGFAMLESEVGSVLTWTRGGAGSLAETSSSDARAEAPSDAFFELVFSTSGSDEPYRLVGAVDAVASGGDAFAAVELIDLDNDAVVGSSQAMPGDDIGFDLQGTLTSRTSYRLTALAISQASPGASPGTATSEANFDALLLLPEPGASVALGAGALLVAALHRRRQRQVSAS